MAPRKHPEVKPGQDFPLLADLVFAPDGRTAAASVGAAVVVLDVAAAKAVAAAPRGDDRRAYRALAFTKGGELAAAGDAKAMWSFARDEAGAWAETGRCALPKRPSSLVAVDGGERLAVGDRFGDVVVVPAGGAALDGAKPRGDGEEEERPLLGHLAAVRALLLLEGGRLLASADADEKVRVSHFPKGHVIESFCLGHRGAVTCLAAAGEGRLLSGSADGTVRLWETRTGRQLACVNLLEAFAAEHEAERKRAGGDVPALASCSEDELLRGGLGLAVTGVHFHAATRTVLCTAHPLAGVVAFGVAEDGASFGAPALVATPGVPAAAALSPADGRLWVLDARFGAVTVLEVPEGGGAPAKVDGVAAADALAAAARAALGDDEANALPSKACEDKAHASKLLSVHVMQREQKEAREARRSERKEAKQAEKAEKHAKRQAELESRREEKLRRRKEAQAEKKEEEEEEDGDAPMKE